MTTAINIESELEEIGIKSSANVFRNLTYDQLFEHETDSSLEGYEKGQVTSSGTITVDTGQFTGRSAKDKYIVKESSSEKDIWWEDQGSSNKALSQEKLETLKDIAITQLNGKNFYIMDGFCGANKDTQMSVRVITEVAWQAHFQKHVYPPN